VASELLIQSACFKQSTRLKKSNAQFLKWAQPSTPPTHQEVKRRPSRTRPR